MNAIHQSTANSYRKMKQRCYDPKNNKYHIYGGKGITVCERWRKGFAFFVEDMGMKPSLKHSIDRYPNRHGNYEPGNCRWATATEQRHNRDVKTVFFDGREMTVQELHEITGVSIVTIYSRLKRGKTPHQAVEVPVRKYVRRNHANANAQR